MICDDCLDELPARHFVVHDTVDVEPDDEPDADLFAFTEKHVCAACVGWYREPIEVGA